MSLKDYFRSPPTMSAENIRELLKRQPPGDFNLLDVRQPGEYEHGHLPGARLVPVGELDSSLKSLDPDKPTITY
ncbi:MAG: rhodanese-like domain-containing protein [Nitrospira sp.]|nr:rhodanese-like domain-containing protein [Nitrospira sp.]